MQVWAISVTYTQFYCEPKTTVKKIKSTKTFKRIIRVTSEVLCRCPNLFPMTSDGELSLALNYRDY